MQNVKTERALPHNLEVERSILGAILLDNQAFNSAAQIVTAADFFGDSNSVIYAAMSALSEIHAGIYQTTPRAEVWRAATVGGRGGGTHRLQHDAAIEFKLAHGRSPWVGGYVRTSYNPLVFLRRICPNALGFHPYGPSEAA